MLSFSLFRNQSQAETILFALFAFIIVVFLMIDLGVFNRSPHKISMKSAFWQSIFWVVVSTIYGILFYIFYDIDDGRAFEATMEYFSSYLTEKALSVDNIFVILVILQYFQVNEIYYHKILFWGIIGAVIFRGVFIFIGSLLIAKFHWILYFFGVFLVYSGIKIYYQKDHDKIDPDKNILLQFCRKYLPITSDERGGKFVTIENNKLLFTPLFLIIVLVESTDVIFAMDSIPAAFAITQDEFIIYTSNIFAVLGLRAMFFLLSSMLNKFYLLQKGLSVILIFIGVKMLLEILSIKISPVISFGVIIFTLALSIIMSVLIPKKEIETETET